MCITIIIHQMFYTRCDLPKKLYLLCCPSSFPGHLPIVGRHPVRCSTTMSWFDAVMPDVQQHHPEAPRERSQCPSQLGSSRPVVTDVQQHHPEAPLDIAPITFQDLILIRVVSALDAQVNLGALVEDLQSSRTDAGPMSMW